MFQLLFDLVLLLGFFQTRKVFKGVLEFKVLNAIYTP